MKNFDIEAYINGELSGDSLQSFEKELSRNPDLRQEVDVYREMINDLQTQSIRDQVTKALSSNDDEGPIDSSAGKRNTKWWLLLLVVGIPVIWWVFLNPSSTHKPINANDQNPEKSIKEAPRSQPEKEQTSPIQDVEKEQPSQTPQKESSKPDPIAENKTTPSIPTITIPPNVRGEHFKNEKWQTLVNSIWSSDFPPEDVQFKAPFKEPALLLSEKNFTMAFVQLQLLERQFPKNDTLSLLKGYCLTELNEGKEAVRYFEQITTDQPKWKEHIEWYKSLNYLIIGELKPSVDLWTQMAAENNHSFQTQSKSALNQLEQYLNSIK